MCVLAQRTVHELKCYKAVKIAGVKHDLHRLIMEEQLGRKLHRNEVVHHIDGNRWNNSPDNLCVMTRSEHARLHTKGRKLPEETCSKISDARKGIPYKHRPLSRQKVFEIIRLLEVGMPTRKIADKLGISRNQITGIVYKNLYQDYVAEYQRIAKSTA
jgi:hypothetical protein